MGKENFREVYDIISGADNKQVRRLDLRPGDLQLFQGRYSLHRVAPVTGRHERHSVIFAYCDRLGMIGKAERARQLFGRVLPAHDHQNTETAHSDSLLD